MIPRIPFPTLVIAGTALAALAALLARPGRMDVLAGVVLGTATAGTFAALAVALLGRARREGGETAGSRMLRAFVGLMAARMLVYLALILAAVFLGAGDPFSVGAGLVGGTLVFQALEIAYLRKMA